MAEGTGRLLSTGSILVDVTVDVPTLPEKGDDVLATGTRTQAGGGFNLAAAAARQGASVVYCGPHGAGPYGAVVRESLLAEGITATQPVDRSADTGFCIVLVEPDAERSFVTMTGAEAVVSAAGLARVEPGPRDIVAVSGYDLAYPGSGPALADWLDRVGGTTTVALDPGPLLPDVPDQILSRVFAVTDVLTLNRREARTAIGGASLAGAELLGSVRETLHLPPRVLIVLREGAAGCVADGGELGASPVRFDAPAVEALDTTGAGDTHTGVLLARILAGEPVRSALAAANVAAALSVTRLGSATAPTRAETDAGAAAPGRDRG